MGLKKWWKDFTGQTAAENAQKKNEQNVYAALDAIYTGSYGALNEYDQSVESFSSALEAFTQGFPGVMDEITGDASLLAAKDQHEAVSGSIDDSLISSGRFGTSARESLQGGENSRYMRDVANINEGLGALRSNVRMQGLQSTAGLMQGLGGAFERRGSISEKQGFKLADTRMGVQYQAGPSSLDAVLGIGGMFAGFGSGKD